MPAREVRRRARAGIGRTFVWLPEGEACRHEADYRHAGERWTSGMWPMMGGMHMRATLLVLLVALGCSGSGEPLDGPVMRYPTSTSEGSDDAEVRGRLELAGDCLYIALDEVDERYPVVWPAGTTWDAEDQAVISPSGTEMAVGSQVYGGGGYAKVGDVERSLGAEAEALVTSCADNKYGEVAFVNNERDAIGRAE